MLSLLPQILLLTGAARGRLHQFTIRTINGELVGPEGFIAGTEDETPLTADDIRDAAAGQKRGVARNEMDRHRLLYDGTLLDEQVDLSQHFPDDASPCELTAVRVACTREDHMAFNRDNYERTFTSQDKFLAMARAVPRCEGWAGVRGPYGRPMVNWATSLITREPWRKAGIIQLVYALLDDEGVRDNAQQELGSLYNLNGHFEQPGSSIHHFAAMGDAAAAISLLERARDMVGGKAWATMVNAVGGDYTPGDTPLAAAIYKAEFKPPSEQLQIAKWLVANGASTEGPEVSHAGDFLKNYDHCFSVWLEETGIIPRGASTILHTRAQTRQCVPCSTCTMM